MKINVNVGDKVVGYDFGVRRIGTVVNITKMRKDIVVDYGNYKETYSSDGFKKGSDIWSHAYIELLTPEIQEDIRKNNLILKCRNTFNTKWKQLTADQAEKILAILNEEDATK